MRRVDAFALRLRLLLAAGALTAASLQRGAKAEAATKAERVCLPPNADDSCPSDEAPAELRLGAKLAAQDEARHARLAFALASAFAGVPIVPGPAAREPYVRRSLADFAASTALEGCTSEPLSVCLLAEALRWPALWG